MNLPGSPLASEDFKKVLGPRWIDDECAERAILRTVDSHTGAELVGRNDGGNYEGIAIAIRWPGEAHPREWILRRTHPDIEIKPEGSRKPKGKYLYPPGRSNLA